MKAVLVSATGRELVDLPIPVANAGEVLIKNVVVASNPKDYKLPLWTPNYVCVEGNDVAGYIEAVGEGVTKFKKGDKAAAFSTMRTQDNKFGAYGEYTVSPAKTAFHLGPKISFENAAALPLAYMTACVGLFKDLGLPTPDAPATSDPRPVVLIYGASTTVGVYALQLAKLAGIHTVGIAGAGCTHATSYGADEIIDYRNKSVAEMADAINAAGGGRIRHVFDCVGEKGSMDSIVKALEGKGESKVSFVLMYTPEQVAAWKEMGISATRTMSGSAHTKGGEDFAEEWFGKLGPMMENATFRAQKVTVVPGGLEGVAEGLRRLQAGEVKSEKLVYRISETPGL